MVECFSRPYQSREVMHMSDFELLTVVFTVIGLLISAFKLGRKKTIKQNRQ